MPPLPPSNRPSPITPHSGGNPPLSAGAPVSTSAQDDLDPEVVRLAEGPLGAYLVEVFSKLPVFCGIVVGDPEVMDHIVSLYNELPEYQEASHDNKTVALLAAVLYASGILSREMLISALQERLGLSPHMAGTVVYLFDHGPVGNARLLNKGIIRAFGEAVKGAKEEATALIYPKSPSLPKQKPTSLPLADTPQPTPPVLPPPRPHPPTPPPTPTSHAPATQNPPTPRPPLAAPPPPPPQRPSFPSPPSPHPIKHHDPYREPIDEK